MRVVIFGASGMIGQGVLRACLLDDSVTDVLLVVRSPLNVPHPKVREVVHADFTDFQAIRDELTGLDACFFCLGVSSAGRDEAAYTRVTFDYTLAAARVVGADNPALTFIYVSGQGTDSTEKGRTMWARVKGRTENALLAMDFYAYMFRPGFIQPLHGEVSRTGSYRVLYRLTSWAFPVLRRLAPRHTTTTEHLGLAMLAVVEQQGAGPRVLGNEDINRLGSR
ncbi:NAD(P)H-binding protein [Streptomyces sp. GESEQ-35]|uniref:NAD(P)H-binding protein n=1 Tax=Streptomyces sp. GESEQ-35 TaxID=2812657 RepID=UPI001B322F79|nr:NAD(P)H-binding protein [Streptomyces sp. GESEQ-35]